MDVHRGYWIAAGISLIIESILFFIGFVLVFIGADLFSSVFKSGTNPPFEILTFLFFAVIVVTPLFISVFCLIGGVRLILGESTQSRWQDIRDMNSRIGSVLMVIGVVSVTLILLLVVYTVGGCGGQVFCNIATPILIITAIFSGVTIFLPGLLLSIGSKYLEDENITGPLVHFSARAFVGLILLLLGGVIIERIPSDSLLIIVMLSTYRLASPGLLLESWIYILLAKEGTAKKQTRARKRRLDDMQYEMMISESSHTERGPNMTTRGVIAEDGFEWVEWPELSGVWYWRDPETNQWFLHE